MQRREAADFTPRSEDRLDGALSDAFDRAQAEAEVLADDGEGVVRLIDVRRQDLDPHLRRLVDELHHLLGAIHLRGHQRGHEGPRVMHLEPCRLIRDERVGDGVRFRKSVAREWLDEVEDLARLLFRVVVGHSAVDKFAALLLHDRLVLLPHRLAQKVGVAE